MYNHVGTRMVVVAETEVMRMKVMVMPDLMSLDHITRGVCAVTGRGILLCVLCVYACVYVCACV